MSQIKSVPVLVPPLFNQKNFFNIRLAFDQIRSQQQEALRQAELLFHSLLTRHFE